jgi:hypothetical protein
MVPKVGPSTVAMLTGAAVVLAAFVQTWAEGSPNVWLAAISAGLTAAVGVLRSWQAVSSEQGEQQ